jgi:hypothetical protein
MSPDSLLLPGAWAVAKDAQAGWIVGKFLCCRNTQRFIRDGQPQVISQPCQTLEL